MNNSTREQSTTSISDPRVIPALSGYVVVRFYVEGGVTPKTTLDDIEMVRNVVVAWLVRPMLRLESGHFEQELIDHGLEPLYPFGGIAADDDLIVDPLGQWTAYESTFPDANSARAWWLSRRLSKGS